MKLFILRSRDDIPSELDPFYPVWDKIHGIVVCAKNEKEARKMANKVGEREIIKQKDTWLNPRYTTCEELIPSTEGVIIANMIHG